MKFKIISRYYGAAHLVRAANSKEAAETFLRLVDASRNKRFGIFNRRMPELVPYDAGMLNAVVVEPRTGLVVAGISNNQIEQPASGGLIHKMRGGTGGACWYLSNVVGDTAYGDATLTISTRLDDKRLKQLSAGVQVFAYRRQSQQVIVELELHIYNDALKRPVYLRQLLQYVPEAVGVEFQSVKGDGDLCRLSVMLRPFCDFPLYQQLQEMDAIFEQFSRCRYGTRGVDIRIIGRFNPWCEELKELKSGYANSTSYFKDPLDL